MKVHNRTDMFIDIEADKKNTWIGCSDGDPDDKISLMTFYLLEDNTTHEFMFRRVIDVKRCLNLQNEYLALADSVSKVRFVGISPRQKDGEKLITGRVPDNFKNAKFKINWTFIRLHTANGCESYFEGDCQPENYWSTSIPPSKEQ
ncbi:MAG: hypothetical protein KDD34_10005 [Bdellovibrionales bacterium]|nr:hypothetical protein [Bdellovibrionales bacterium]